MSNNSTCLYTNKYIPVADSIMNLTKEEFINLPAGEKIKLLHKVQIANGATTTYKQF